MPTFKSGRRPTTSRRPRAAMARCASCATCCLSLLAAMPACCRRIARDERPVHVRAQPQRRDQVSAGSVAHLLPRLGPHVDLYPAVDDGRAGAGHLLAGAERCLLYTSDAADE